MKKILIIGIYMVCAATAFAQDVQEVEPVAQDPKVQERIKSLRIAYISDKLGLTPEQAEKLRLLAEKQGTLGKSTFENLLGSGATLWETDEEFEAFLERIRDIRQAKV